MATKKDLVEAYSFSRRRLVTAFVSGAPGGREVEPARPGRSIVGGVALAVLMVAIGAVIGFLRNPSAPDWDTAGLITEKESGAAYLNMPPPPGSDDDRFQLRPLQNITSALLIFDGEADAQRVPHDRISERPRGPGIGILGAPATPPEASRLVQTGWTACTTDASVSQGDPAGTSLTISAETDVVPVPDRRFVVRAPDGGTWLIAEAATRDFALGQRAYRYRVPQSGATNAILSALGGTSTPVPVSDEWLALFPQGAALALNELDIGTVGASWAGAGYNPKAAGAKVGGLLRVGPEENYLLTETGKGAIRLDAFSLQLYQRLVGKEYPDPIDIERGPGDYDEIDNLPQQLSWPSSDEVGPRPQGRLCAVLDPQPGQPGVNLGTRAAPSSEDPAPSGETSVVVDSGAGAFVYSGDWEPGPVTPVLVDDQGTRFPVAEQADEARLLGYGDVERVVVPDSWLDLLTGGVELSRAAALCPPSSQPGAGGCAS
ncbi:type VII secretion protein EccB [Nocardioides sp. C4-1]|uniref:type VII secretion protein EccB n=1 Tax=Nocardioides sp. C4-1 TaxID=3151851 RepID=UPI003266512E